jgi:hypothetical protein
MSNEWGESFYSVLSTYYSSLSFERSQTCHEPKAGVNPGKEEKKS